MTEEQEQALQLATEAGHILLENGAEISRVEDTMSRIASTYGVEDESFFVLSNGIITTGQHYARAEFIPIKGTQLAKVAAVNQLSRDVSTRKMSLEALGQSIQAIRSMPGKPWWELLAGIAVGVAATVLFYIFIRPICSLLGADGQMLEYSVHYGRIVLLVMPFYMIQMAFHSLYMTAEIPQMGTRLSIISGLTNIVLDALLIVVLDWGLTGAAIATAAGMAVGGIYPLYYFSSRSNTTHLRFVRTRTNGRSILQVCTNGLSEYVGNISLSVVSMCYNLQLMRLIGEEGVAVYGILMYIGFVYASVFIGFNLAIAPVISYNYGAQNHEELKRLLRKSLILLFVAGSILTLLSEVLSGPMAGIFVGYDVELKALTAHAIRLYMLSFMICGINMFVSAYFTALNNGLVSALAAFARTLVFELGAVFVLPLFMGLDGVWLAVDLADVLALIMSAILLSAAKGSFRNASL